jgi:hypothetical protein
VSLSLLGVSLPTGVAPAHAADPRWGEREANVRKALRSEDPKERARAFDPLRETDDPRAVELVIEGVRTIREDQEKIRKTQAVDELAYQKLVDEQQRNVAQFAASGKSERDLDRYNATDRKISKGIDAARAKARDVENQILRTKAQVDNAALALGAVLNRLPAGDLSAALTRLESAWFRSKQAGDPLLYVDVISAVQQPWVGDRLRMALPDATLPLGLRGAILVALASRKDPELVDLAAPWLQKPPEEFVGIAAAIEALRLRHDRGSIEPLIAFLKREDVKRLREDARNALMSLTGQEHGPYFDPWDAWWRDAKATFGMPPEPVYRRPGQQKGGVTFYGIHTFSDRILFVLDVSKSMDKPAKPAVEGQPVPGERIDVARREIAGAIGSMNDGERFNVILFNHSVIPWQARMTEVSDATKKQAIRWAQSQPALGGTNLHDALEAAFQMAQRVTGRPDLDTVMFMTDGTATAGKLREASAILDAVREWNRTARLTIHCIGVGEEFNPDFLAELAKIGNGEYVKR